MNHVHRLCSNGGLIFGLDSDFFVIGYDRANLGVFQELLGVKDTPKGKRYPMLPPILYPAGSSMDPKKLFLNPALINVSDFPGVRLPYGGLTYIQILKVVLFGPSSLGTQKSVPGPKPAGKKWGLKCVTPKAIAFAAILVGLLPLLQDVRR